MAWLESRCRLIEKHRQERRRPVRRFGKPEPAKERQVPQAIDRNAMLAHAQLPQFGFEDG
jgi:hypothetical protein